MGIDEQAAAKISRLGPVPPAPTIASTRGPLSRRPSPADRQAMGTGPEPTTKLGSAFSPPGAPPEQKARGTHSPLPAGTGGTEPNTLGSASSIPAPPSPKKEQALMRRGGDADPNILASAHLIRDPALRAAFLRAYTAWEKAQ